MLITNLIRYNTITFIPLRIANIFDKINKLIEKDACMWKNKINIQNYNMYNYNSSIKHLQLFTEGSVIF